MRDIFKFWFLGVCLFSTAPSFAYVDPSFHIIRQITKKHSSINELRIRSRLVFYNKDGEAVRTFTEILGFDNFSKANVRIVDAEGIEVGFKSRSQISADRQRPLSYDLLFARDFNLFFERLQSFGFPLKTEEDLYAEKEGILPYKPEPWVNLRQFEGKGLLVIGDFKARTPQLWVTKPNRRNLRGPSEDEFQIVRAVYFASFDGSRADSIEFRFRNPKEYRGTESRTFFFPTKTEILKDGYLWATLEVQELRSGHGASNLDAAHVKSEPSGDAKQLIESYLKWIR